MSQPARAIGQIWQSIADQRNYTITSANGSDWNAEREDGAPFLFTDAWFDKSATLIGNVAATANTPAPTSSTTQPVAQPPKYWVGQKVTSTNTGRTYTIHAYDPQKKRYDLIKANGLVVPGYSVQDLDMYTTIDPGQTPPTVSAAIVATPTYKIGDRFKGASSGTIYTIKSQIGPEEWLLTRDNGSLVQFYDSDIASLIPISTSAANTSEHTSEPKKPCCSIGALKAEEGKPCPLHKPAKPKYDFSDLVSEWDLLPDAYPAKWWT